MRKGGSPNGKFRLAKYDGTEWTSWSDFNAVDASDYPGQDYNWGLYGSLNYLNGKFHMGFSIRTNMVDKYKYNNGFYYAWSKDPVSNPQWYNAKGEPIETPLIDPSVAFIAEPGDAVPADGDSSVVMSGGRSWTITERGDMHFVHDNVRGANNTRENVHIYRKAGDSEFTMTTDFPGGSLERIGDDIYIIGLNEAGRHYIQKAEGGTNDWVDFYEADSGKVFRHGNIHIIGTKVYYYLMEKGTGSAQPLYVQVYDLANQ